MKTALDMFCGAGGWTLGAKHAGLIVTHGVDNDPEALDCYRNNHSEVEIVDRDVRDVIWSGSCNVLLASPPCQGHSSAARPKRPRIDSWQDEQNDLAFEVLRAAEALTPDLIIVENVPEMAQWSMFPEWTQGFVDLGYVRITWEAHMATDWGVPQRRRRLIVSAHKLPRPPIVRPDYSLAFTDEPAKTLTTRTVMPVDEMARLQTFPDNYRWPPMVEVARRLIGNAMPPMMATRILESLLRLQP